LYGNLTGGGVKPETDTLKYDPVNQGYINIKTGMPATAAEVASIPGNRNMITEMFTGHKSPVEYLRSGNLIRNTTGIGDGKPGALGLGGEGSFFGMKTPGVIKGKQDLAWS
jgi:hypothetical protein